MFFHSPVKTSGRRGAEVVRSALLPRPTQTLPGATPASADLGQGQALPSNERALWESRLGQDFSGVRVYADQAAAASARDLGANAYAIGEDIVFAAGRYRPGTTQGDRLLAHELAHVTQQRRGGSVGSAGAEPRARAVADTVSAGGQVSQEGIGSAPEGVYFDDDEEKKAEGGDPAPAPSPGPSGPSLLPPMPPLTLPPLDWRTMRESFTSRGQRLTMRDMDSILLERQRSSQLLSTLGIGEGFKLGPITKDWILEKGLSKQLEDQQARENPTALDKMDREWKQAHPGGWETPMIMSPNLLPGILNVYDWLKARRNK